MARCGGFGFRIDHPNSYGCGPGIHRPKNENGDRNCYNCKLLDQPVIKNLEIYKE